MRVPKPGQVWQSNRHGQTVLLRATDDTTVEFSNLTTGRTGSMRLDSLTREDDVYGWTYLGEGGI